MSAPADPACRLATYGTLAPGRANHHQMAGMRGTWRAGTVRGTLHAKGWGATMGYPALILDPTGPVVPVMLFESPDLPDHWARLDAFEGEAYRRVVARIKTEDGPVAAWLYAVAQ